MSKEKYKEFISIILLHDSNVHIKSRSNIPVCFMRTNKKQTLIDRQIELIDKKFDKYEIIVSANDLAPVISKHIKLNHPKKNIRVIENTNFSTTNSCESIRLCIQNINNDKIFIINGNLFFNHSVLNGLNFSKSFALVNSGTNENLDIGVNVHDSNVQFFCYGASKCWSEILFINGAGTISDLYDTIGHKNFKTRFLFEAMNEILHKHRIKEKNKKCKIIKIKSHKTYNKYRS